MRQEIQLQGGNPPASLLLLPAGQGTLVKNSAAELRGIKCKKDFTAPHPIPLPRGVRGK